MLALVAVALAADAEALEPTAPSPEVLAFDRFVVASGPVCERAPSATCVDVAWAYVDLDADGGLSEAELRRVRAGLIAWFNWRGADLVPRERNAVQLGLWAVDTVGLKRLHGVYDLDRDGRVDRAELLTDVALDQRPLGEVLLDPEAVDRRAVAQRLGAVVPLLEQALPALE